jgi:hypothetical protein
MREIEVNNDFFPKEMYDRFIAEYKDAPMRYGWFSNNKTDPHGHWNYSIVRAGPKNIADISSKLNGVVEEMWEYTKQHLKEDVALIRCYINSHTYGIEGYFHTDSFRQDEKTSVLYMNEIWYPNWAGETVFMEKEDKTDIIKCVLPCSNRLVIFPSNMMHSARAVSRKCMDLRMTFMFKFRKRRSENFEKLSKFLFENGAQNENHQVGSLHDHLVRVYQILETKGYPEHVCFGGGLHSVFGTNVFKKNIFDDSDKQKIIDNFGQKAFELSKLFSSIKRPKTLETPTEITEDKFIVELNNDACVALPVETYFELCAIECANLIDQNSFNQTKYPTLNKFWSQNVIKNK